MPIEEQLLPHEELASWYEKVVWIYVCRTWDEDAGDLEAARIHDRFGVTSWPHLFVIDPLDGRVLARVGRSLAALQAAFGAHADAVAPPSEGERARVRALAEAERVGEANPVQAVAALRRLAEGSDGVEVAFEARERLRALEGDSRTLDERLAAPSPHERILAVEALAQGGDEEDTPTRRRALQARLQDPREDAVVRHRALTYLLERDPASVLRVAEPLLVSGSDPMRFAVLDAIREHPTAKLTPVLVRLFAEAGTTIPSGNPNVLRMRAARCLEASGDAGAIDVLEPLARAADARNVTTRMVVNALGAIASRGDADVRERVAAILRESFPAAVEAEEGAKPSSTERYALRLVEAIASALSGILPDDEKLPDPPDRWTPATRAAFLPSWPDRVPK